MIACAQSIRFQRQFTIKDIFSLQESWLTSLDMAGLRLRCSVYFGSVQVHDRVSTTSPLLMSADKDSYGNMVCIQSTLQQTKNLVCLFNFDKD